MAIPEEVIPPEPAPKDDAAQEAQDQADFDAGAAMETTATPKDGDRPRDGNGRFVAGEETPAASATPGKKKEEPAVAPGKKKEEPAAAPPAKPEYVQITKDQLTKFEAALGRTEDFEKQFSKVFGTVGDMQKILRGLQAQTPKGAVVKLPPGLFDAMKKDFPELAEHTQKIFEAALQGAEGTGASDAKPDPEDLERKVEERVLKLAAEDLVDEFPDWKKIVGAVDTRKGETADPNNPFRKWLGTKPQDYQDRINGTASSGVITRAIRTFKSETKAAPPPPPPKPNGQAEAGRSRISDAVRPKGDGGHPPGASAEDEFEVGFKTG